MTRAWALAHAGLVGLPVRMHLAVATRVPSGRFTVGDRFAGRFPPAAGLSRLTRIANAARLLWAPVFALMAVAAPGAGLL